MVSSRTGGGFVPSNKMFGDIVSSCDYTEEVGRDRNVRDFLVKRLILKLLSGPGM